MYDDDEDVILEFISQFYGKNDHDHATIFRLLADHEVNYGSRADSPHWKMLKQLVRYKQVFPFF